MSALDQLPAELLLQIITNPDYLTRVRLQSTNRYFSLVVDHEACIRQDKRSAVILAETLPQNIDAFGCFLCFKVLPASAFDDWRIGRAYPGDEPDSAHGYPKGGWNQAERHCLDCGFRAKLRSPGETMYVQGVKMVVCCKCRDLKTSQVCVYCKTCTECSSLCLACLTCKDCLDMINAGLRGRYYFHCVEECKYDSEHQL